MEQYKCLRCGHTWYPRTPEKPKCCAKCNSPYWDIERKNIMKTYTVKYGANQQDTAEIKSTNRNAKKGDYIHN